MSSILDPAKLKVVELRAELSNRGLDAKGIKAVLVKRLKDALEEELKTELPDTSIADTSTEDFNTSQEEKALEEPPAKEPDEVAKEEPAPAPKEPPKEEPKVEPKPEEESMDTTEETQKESETVTPIVLEEKPAAAETTECSESAEPTKSEENGEEQDIENDAPPSKKTRFDDDADKTDEVSTENADGDGDAAETGDKKEEAGDGKESNEEPGQKRKRHPAADAPKPRAKSPIKEDEPPIDNNKVQLNWYDSDLHLQIDKESFLKAKPYHDGAFGYVWAGVRATHGSKTGKVCFEVKVTEELKWEDIIKQPERGNRDRDRKDSKRRPEKRSKSESEEKKEQPKATSENGTPEEKDKETSEETKEEPAQTEEVAEGSAEKMDADDVKEEEVKPTDSEEKKDDKEEDKAIDSGDEKKDEGESKPEEEKKDQESAGDENVEEKMETEEAPKEEIKVPEVKIPSHLIRIGWSTISNGLQLGESKFSYGFESSGKFVTDKEFTDYGKAFTVGDVIGAFLEFSDDSVNISYTINGEELSIATSVPLSEFPEGEVALFPHVLSKNYAFEVNFGDCEEPFCTIPESMSTYEFVNKAEDKVLGPQRPENRSECEVIMMCGLPAAGKTHWVKEYLTQNPDKKYTIIGNSQLLEKMTVDGTPLKSSIQGSWPNMVDKLPRCLNKLVEVASLRRRNYVIDQTNEIHSVQRRRMRSFEGFKRRTVIVVCSDEEQAKRQALHEADSEVPISNASLMEIKANLTLPRVGDWVEEVTYVELNEQDAKAMVAKYNKEGKDAGYGYSARRDHGKKFGKWQDNRRSDNRGGYRHKPYHQRFERGHKQGDWKSPRWSHSDRRDNRDSQSGSREWRPPRGNGPRHQDRSRDDRHRSSGGRDNYNRHGNQGRSWQNSSGSGGRNWNNAWGGSNWQGGSGGGGGGGYWNQGSWTPNQGSKWNQGYNQSGYGQGNSSGNWNYYGNYSNWNPNQSGSNGNGA